MSKTVWYKTLYGWQDNTTLHNRRAFISASRRELTVWLKPLTGVYRGWEYKAKKFKKRNEAFDFAEDYLSKL